MRSTGSKQNDKSKMVNDHAVGCGEGPWALVAPVKAIRVGVGLLYKKMEYVILQILDTH